MAEIIGWHDMYSWGQGGGRVAAILQRVGAGYFKNATVQLLHAHRWKKQSQGPVQQTARDERHFYNYNRSTRDLVIALIAFTFFKTLFS